MKKTIDLFFNLIKTEICNAPASDLLNEEITDEQLNKLYNLSFNHDLAHLVSDALLR